MSVAGGFPLRSLGKPKLGSQAQSSRTGKGAQVASGCERYQRSVGQGQRARNADTPLKGQHTKFRLQPLTLGPAVGGQSGLEQREESLELVTQQ